MCEKDGWMMCNFNSFSVISGQWAGNYEMEPCLRLKRSTPQAGLELRTANQYDTAWIKHFVKFADGNCCLLFWC